MDSSLWDEPDFVVKVFLTMMALKDADHIVRLTAYQIGRNARKTEPEVIEALKVLSEPDTRRLEKQDFNGRRIEKVEDGWLILNGQKYRDMVSEEMKKARNRRAQAAWRDRQKMKKGGPLPGEDAYIKALERGDEAGAAKILDGLNRVPIGTPVSGESSVDARGENGQIPEIPLSDQEPGLSKSASQESLEPPTESGSMIDGVWVPE